MTELNQTCETCDWWCYGTFPANTCDKWERTVYEIDVPDEIFGMLTKPLEPNSRELREIREEIDAIEREIGGMEES